MKYNSITYFPNMWFIGAAALEKEKKRFWEKKNQEKIMQI